jgi:hypothetical protein
VVEVVAVKRKITVYSLLSTLLLVFHNLRVVEVDVLIVVELDVLVVEPIVS